MSARRAERLVNLVLALLSTRQYLTVGQIRRSVPGYEGGGEEAFRRMFERDKAELRDLGVPLETGTDSIWDTEPGYRIARRDYELPDIALEPDEAAAVGLAARLWQSGFAAATGTALLKLRAAGVDVDTRLPMDVEPRVDAAEPALRPCLDAVRTGRAVAFDYRGARAAAPQRRDVEPWGVVSWHGRWYLVGHDRDRGAVRCFRLSRVVGAVTVRGPHGAVRAPDGVDLVAQVAALAGESETRTARVRLRPGAATGLRRVASAVHRGEDGDVVEVRYADPERFADRVAGYGADAVVLDPPEVRDAVVRRLSALAEQGAP